MRQHTAVGTRPTTRTLAPSEQVAAPARNTIRMTVHCDGQLEHHLLQRAWQMVGAELPGFAATLRNQGDDYLVRLCPERAGLLVRRAGTPEKFGLTGHRALDDLDCVAALEVTSATSHHHLVSLLVRHSVADGRHALHALRRIWQLYTQMAESHAEPALQSPVRARPLEDLLADHTAPQGTSRLLKPPAPPVYQCGAHWNSQHLSGLNHTSIRLSEQNTTRLLSRCAAASLSLHGVLAASLILAIGFGRPDLATIDLTSVIDVRPHLNPQVSAAEGTYILGFSTSQVDLADPVNLEDVARSVLGDIRADLESGAAQRSSVTNAELRSSGAVPTMVSNLGAVAMFDHPDSLTFTDFSAWNEMDLSQPGSRDVLAAYGNMVVGSTFAGRLRVDLFHGRELFPDDWNATQGRHLERLLTDYAAGTSLFPRVAANWEQ
jgi:phenolphthiocerol/phthiocerol/phthiodiolone dimycocerosyl transferase